MGAPEKEPASALPEVDNPFSEATLNTDISLSVFSNPRQVIARRPRPATSNEQLLKHLPGYKPKAAPVEVGPDGEPLPVATNGEYVREPVLPDLPDLSEKITKDATEQYRQEQLMEVFSIKDRLAHDGCQSNLKVIQRAILMPQESQVQAGLFKYPDPSTMLMQDPNPKKKKKKKGKKGKKK